MSIPTQKFRRLLHSSVGKSIGLLCLMGALFGICSVNATVFEMWSLPFFIIIVVVAFASVLTIRMSCIQLFDPHAVGSLSPQPSVSM